MIWRFCVVLAVVWASSMPAGAQTAKPTAPHIAVLYKAETTTAIVRTDRAVQETLIEIDRELTRRSYRVVQPDPAIYKILDRGPSVLVTFDPKAGLALLLSAESSIRDADTPERIFTEVSLTARIMLGPEVLAPASANARIEARRDAQAQGLSAAARRAAARLVEDLHAQVKALPPERLASLEGRAPRVADHAVLGMVAPVPSQVTPAPAPVQPRPGPAAGGDVTKPPRPTGSPTRPPPAQPASPPTVQPEAERGRRAPPVGGSLARPAEPSTPPGTSDDRSQRPGPSAGAPIDIPAQRPESSAGRPIEVPAQRPEASASRPIEVPAQRPEASAGRPIEVPAQRPEASAGRPIVAPGAAADQAAQRPADPPSSPGPRTRGEGEPGLPRPPRVHALIVGLWDFSPLRNAGERGWSDLPGVRNDVTLLQTALRQLGANPDDIRTLTNNQATQDALARELRLAVNRVKAGDLFVLYISSHGAPKKFGVNAFGLPVLSDFARYADADRMDFWTIQAMVMNLPTDKILWIVDTCHAGGAMLGLTSVTVGPGSRSISTQPAGSFSAEVAVQSAVPGKNMAVLSSSLPDQVSLGGRGASVFTQVLVEQVGKLANGSRTIGSVFEENVQPTVAARTRETCRAGCSGYDAQYAVLGRAGRGHLIRF